MTESPHKQIYNGAPSLSIRAALAQAKTLLCGYPTAAALDVEVLLAHVLAVARVFLHTWPERTLQDEQRARFFSLVKRRAAGEPIAYLTHCREFWSMDLWVTPNTLIPRPETELLIDLALQRIPADASLVIADLGTGSGAIALALARERPRCRVVATDISLAALEVAHANALRLNMQTIEFRLGSADWCTPLQGEHFDLILSNPPYVRSDDPCLTSGETRFEPRTALDAGPEGLEHLRNIARQTRRHLNSGGCLLLEHGFDQGSEALQLLIDLGYGEVRGHRDLTGQARVASARYRGA